MLLILNPKQDSVKQGIKNDTTSLQQLLLSKIRKIFIVPRKITLNVIQSWNEYFSKFSIFALYLLDETFFKQLKHQLQIEDAGVKEEFQTKYFYTFVISIQRILTFFNQLSDQLIQKTVYKFIKNNVKNNKSLKSDLLKRQIYRQIQKFPYLYSKRKLSNICKHAKQFCYMYLHSYVFPSELQTKRFQDLKTEINFRKQKNNQEVQFKYFLNLEFEKNNKKNYSKEIRQLSFFTNYPSAEIKELSQKIIAYLLQIETQILNYLHKKYSNGRYLAQQPGKNQNLHAFQQNIQIQQLYSSSCINCIQFFYENLPCPRQRNYLRQNFVFNSVKSIKTQRDRVIQSICALLNSGGGTILFGCIQNKFGFIPLGQQKIKLKQQEGLSQSFKSLINYVSSQQKQLIQCKVDFLPIKQNPLKCAGAIQKGTQYKQASVRRPYLDQRYVMRAYIKPETKYQLYLAQIDKKKYFLKIKDHNVYTVKQSQEYELQKKKKQRDFIDITQNHFVDTQLKPYQIIKQVVQQNMSNNVKSQTKLFISEMHFKGNKYGKPNTGHEGPCKQTRTIQSNYY